MIVAIITFCSTLKYFRERYTNVILKDWIYGGIGKHPSPYSLMGAYFSTLKH